MLHRKRTMIVIIASVSVMILAAGCVAGQPLIQVKTPPQTDTTEVAAAVNAIWREYVDSRLAGDADRAMAIWDEEGVQMPPDTPPRVGKAAIAAAVSAAFDRVTYLEMEVVPEELSISGDIAISRGHYSVSRVAKAGGEPVYTDGKFMTFIRRQPDGSWKIYRDIFNSNVPPAPAAAPTTDADEVAAAVNAIWREYEDSLLAGDADRWIAQWMEDGVQMPPNMPPRVGKETIYTAVSGFLSQFEYTEFAIENEDVEVNGPLAFARGTYAASFVAKSGGDPTHIEGKYMTIMRQQPDGSWKIYRDIFNSNVPPAPAAAPATDADEVAEAVNALWREYEASIEAEDADRWGELWVGDGVKYPPDAPPLEGKEAIVNNMREWMAAATAKEVAISNHDVQVVGDYAFARGLFRADNELKANGMPVVMDGKYMSILQRQADGSWKLYRDIFNSNVPPVPAAAPTTDIDEVTADAADAINATWREYEASILAGDPERWIALWAEDGVQLPPGAYPNVGKETILAGITEDLTTYEYSEFAISNEDVEVDGDLAFARGSYAVTFAPKSGGDSMNVNGKYMTIFRHQPDGSWKIYRDIFNSNVP